MASKTRKRRQKERRQAIETASSDVVMQSSKENTAGVTKRKNPPKGLKHKHKIRLGHQTEYDIYDEFESKNAQLQEETMCGTCRRPIRTKGYCVWCATKS